MTRPAGTYTFIHIFYRGAKGDHTAHSAEAHSLDAKIDRAELRERYKTYLVGHYLSLHITVVSVVLAAGGLAAASLISRPAGQDNDLLILWVLWIGSFAATAVAYGGPMVGAFALPAAIPSVVDLVLPLLVGLSEFLLFTILINQVNPAGTDRTLNSWLLTMAVFCFVAALSVLRARHHYATGVDESVYSVEVATMIRRYISYLKYDACLAGIASAVVAMGAGLRMSHSIAWPALTFPIAINVMLFLGLWGHMRVVTMWRELMPNKFDAHHKTLAGKHEE